MNRTRITRGFLRIPLGTKVALALALGAVLAMGSAHRGDAAPATPLQGSAAQEEAPSQPGEVVGQEQLPPAAEVHTEAEDHGPDAADFFLVIIAILVFAKLFGEGAERIGQPAVLGELVAGLILGGSMLGIVPTDGEMANMIHLLAEVGVAILLFEIGLETDLKEMFRVGASSASVAAVGVFMPFLLGFLYWLVFDPNPGVRPEGISLGMVAIFVGATLTATSVGITARVLTDLRLMHRSESRIIIGAAVIDDVLGLVILAVVSGLAAGTALSIGGIAWTFIVAVGFLVLAVVVGNFVAPGLFSLIDRMSVRGVLLVSAFCFALLFAALAAKAGSAMIIGSFAAGIVLSATNQFDLIVERIEPVADIFTPIFFVSVGAAVNMQLFNPLSDVFNGQVIIVGLMLIIVAVIGKLASGYVVGWGKKKLNHLAIGIGMVPRGEVGLIFADIGRRAGILSPEAFSAILIMVIVTTFIAPPLLKIVFRTAGDDGGAGPAEAGHTPLHGGSGVHGSHSHGVT
ncbi:MAG: cation:proton antiporter [Gemmatimonadetes bacterium]|nr:cation:proton antiporter [Gemmatimonadota bacterium]